MKIKLQMLLCLLMFGSIGIFVTFIDLPSVAIVQWRTIIATLFTIGLFCIRRKKPDWAAIRTNVLPLSISGLVLGANWACLFEAFQRTAVGMATILYYCAPIFVFIAAPIFFKEKITRLQLIGISAAITGTILVNLMGLYSGDFSPALLFALVAAILYATVMICNRFMKNISGMDSSFIQLTIAAIVMTVYSFISTGNLLTFAAPRDMILVTILGVVHTGMIFPLYFYAVQKLSPQNTAIFSYLDPASALLFAFLFLQENLAWYQLLGALLIFGGVLFAQLQTKN
ncbi:MAG: DMT family transporter [Faecalibacterium sp.]